MFGSIREVKAANKRSGGNWFEPATMRFFGSKVEGSLIEGRFFVASSCMDESAGTQRKHSVHHAAPDGKISTPSGFHRFDDAASARRWLKIALADGLAAAEAAFADVKPQVRAFDVEPSAFPEPK